jgi:hypothetical protein
MRRTDESNAYGVIEVIVRFSHQLRSKLVPLTITNNCPNLEKFCFAHPGGCLVLGSDVIEAFASLTNLTFLDVGKVDVEALAILSKCTRLFLFVLTESIWEIFFSPPNF